MIIKRTVWGKIDDGTEEGSPLLLKLYNIKYHGIQSLVSYIFRFGGVDMSKEVNKILYIFMGKMKAIIANEMRETGGN